MLISEQSILIVLRIINGVAEIVAKITIFLDFLSISLCLIDFYESA